MLAMAAAWKGCSAVGFAGDAMLNDCMMSMVIIGRVVIRKMAIYHEASAGVMRFG